MKNKIQLAVVFGGRSVEHEVSILTGHQVLAAVDRDKYAVQAVYLDRDNIWYIGDEAGRLDFFRQKNPPLDRLTRVFPAPDARAGKLRLIEASPKPLRRAQTVEIDCVIPATHGTFVEDGSLQGILEMANVPFAGSGVRGSAAGMDKVLFKAVLKAEGLPCLPFVSVSRLEWETAPDDVAAKIKDELGESVFVKPATLGSSIGISRVDPPQPPLERGERESRPLSKAAGENHSFSEGAGEIHPLSKGAGGIQIRLEDAIDLALKFSDRALVEKAVGKPKEINCSVIDGDPPIPSVLEQPVSGEELLTFDEKYKGKGGKKGAKASSGGKGMAGQQRIIPAPLDEETTRQIQEYAVRAFQASGAGGVARIDFLIDTSQNNPPLSKGDGGIPPLSKGAGGIQIYINELNNIPGSLSFYLWEYMGKSFTDLIDRLVERAFEVNRIRNRTVYSFDANLLAGG